LAYIGSKEGKSMKSKFIIVVAAAVIVIAVILMAIFFILSAPKLKSGYTELEGFLELRAYPKISQAVPTVMVYILVPKYDNYEIYLTENGLPLSSLEGFSENDLVKIEGVLYNRDAIDNSETYWMIEIFNVSVGD
jgi:hypothetical protein